MLTSVLVGLDVWKGVLLAELCRSNDLLDFSLLFGLDTLVLGAKSGFTLRE